MNLKIKELTELFQKYYSKRIANNAIINQHYKIDENNEYHWYITGGWDERKNKISSPFVRPRN
jgi:hypothetical protein